MYSVASPTAVPSVCQRHCASVLLCPSLQFAHCSMDSWRPDSVPCKWKRVLNLAVSLGGSWPSVSAPRRCLQPLGTEDESRTLKKLNWIFNDEPGLAVAQMLALPRIARKVWQTHKLPLPPSVEVQCMQASWYVARMGGSALAVLRCPSFHHLKNKNPKELTEMSPRRASFTKMNPSSVN